ncbi:MAG: iron-sulfur cluster assembly scaffold protein, partial [Candidatus Pacearchaeota archaeon]|nr:iron-sulfur cluster assembly scaffold protein [Candidatus Pacearchaeota archaeon]
LEDEESYKDDGKGTVGNIKCGDQMMIVIKVEDDRIQECKWKTYGCASAIASTSMLSETVIGMTLDQAYHVSPKDITERLGGLPEHKIHCSVLGDKALRAAIDNYYKRSGQENRIKKEQARTICQCMSVTDKDIDKAVKNGVKNFIELQQQTKISTVCGQCRQEAEEYLHQSIHLYGDE